MKPLIILAIILVLITPTITALESCEKDICFNKQEQNCLFMALLPYNIMILISFVGIFFLFEDKIKNQSSKRKAFLTTLAFFSFVLITFALGKLFIFNKCLLQ